MLDRIAKTLRPRAARLAGSFLLLSVVPAVAQAQPPPVSPAQFDPSDVYFQGFLATRAAEQLEQEGDFIGAAAKLADARRLFETVRRYYPDWKSEMVRERARKNSETESRLFPLAEEQRREKRMAVAELEGGARQGGELIDPAEGVVPLTPGILEINPNETRRLNDAEAEVKRLRELLAAKPDMTEAARNESRLRDIARQRDALQAQLGAAEKTAENLRRKLAAQPVEAGMKALEERIAGLQQEREAMAMALSKSRESHTEALAQIDILQADLRIMQKKRADLDRDLQTEREVSNAVVSGQRAQIQELEKELLAKTAELDAANEKIASLGKELEESRANVSELMTERDGLLAERDQMRALLKLNEDGRIQDLIQQNMSLAKDLREANERVEMLNRDNNATKDSLTAAIRDLGLAKARINRLSQERREQDQRLADLEARLKNEESALAKGASSTNSEEVAMLRDIIQRQLRIQKRREQARDLLLEAVKEMGTKDERLAQAVALFEGQEIQLTPEEQRLLADKQVDGEFVSPFAQDRATVGRNIANLNQDISVYERLAEKSYAAGRYLSTREFFETIVEQHPGHVRSLCALGVVHLKLGEPDSAADAFQRAVELAADNPYAHMMLAFSRLQMGDLNAAKESAAEAVALAPDDARCQILAGKVDSLLGQFDTAEEHFKAAITADPMLSDAYFNLAVLYAQTKRLEEGRDFYNQALERGAIPDPALEKRLSIP